MSEDEQPTSDEAPSSEDAAPTSEASEASEAGANDATVPDQSTSAETGDPGVASDEPASTASSDRAGVFVPRWVAVVAGGLVAVLIVGGAGFALGRADHDDHDRREAVEAGPRTQLPGGGDRGERGEDGGERGERGERGEDGDRGGRGEDGGGDGPSIPDIPNIPSRGVLLGIAVEPASGATEGAQVAQVVPGSPADDAGLESGDVITEVDGTAITDPSQLVEEVQSHSSGDAVTIVYDRDGESNTIDVTLGGNESGSDASSSN